MHDIVNRVPRRAGAPRRAEHLARQGGVVTSVLNTTMQAPLSEKSI